MYFYCRTYTQSTDRKLRKPETDDVSIRAASGYALIASISTSTSTSGRDRFFPSAEPKKPASRTRASARVRHARSPLSGEKWRNKNGQSVKLPNSSARVFFFFFFSEAAPPLRPVSSYFSRRRIFKSVVVFVGAPRGNLIIPTESDFCFPL